MKPTVKRVVSREGWASPIFADRVIKVIDGTPQTIEGIEIQTKLHELKPERLDLVESCNPQNDSLEENYNETDFDIEKYTTYELKGKVFAYEVPYQFIQAEDGYDIGAGIINFYFDEDGSGNFKLRCDDNNELQFLPSWIKNFVKK